MVDNDVENEDITLIGKTIYLGPERLNPIII
jgi:hypothetical protein